MLIKMPKEEKIIPRTQQLSYSTQDILNLFSNKYPCKECPFVVIWTDKAPEGTKDIHRMYCKFAHVSLRNLPAILGLSIAETWKQVELLKKKSPLAPTTVKIHPKNKKRFILSCLLTKELENSCIMDNYIEGKVTLDRKILDYIAKWREKYLGKK